MLSIFWKNIHYYFQSLGACSSCLKTVVVETSLFFHILISSPSNIGEHSTLGFGQLVLAKTNFGQLVLANELWTGILGVTFRPKYFTASVWLSRIFFLATAVVEKVSCWIDGDGRSKQPASLLISWHCLPWRVSRSSSDFVTENKFCVKPLRFIFVCYHGLSLSYPDSSPASISQGLYKSIELEEIWSLQVSNSDFQTSYPILKCLLAIQTSNSTLMQQLIILLKSAISNYSLNIKGNLAACMFQIILLYVYYEIETECITFFRHYFL